MSNPVLSSLDLSIISFYTVGLSYLYLYIYLSVCLSHSIVYLSWHLKLFLIHSIFFEYFKQILEVKETAGPLCHASWPVTREIPAGTVEKTTPALNCKSLIQTFSDAIIHTIEIICAQLILGHLRVLLQCVTFPLSSGVISPCGSQPSTLEVK